MTLQEVTLVQDHCMYKATVDTKTPTQVNQSWLASPPPARNHNIDVTIMSTDCSSSLGCANKETAEA